MIGLISVVSGGTGVEARAVTVLLKPLVARLLELVDAEAVMSGREAAIESLADCEIREVSNEEEVDISNIEDV